MATTITVASRLFRVMRPRIAPLLCVLAGHSQPAAVDREVEGDVSLRPRDPARDFRSGIQKELLVDLGYATELRNRQRKRIERHG